MKENEVAGLTAGERAYLNTCGDLRNT